jgi:hypothetical protein
LWRITGSTLGRILTLRKTKCQNSGWNSLLRSQESDERIGADVAGTAVGEDIAGRMTVRIAVHRVVAADCRVAVGHKGLADSSADTEVERWGKETYWSSAAADSQVGMVVESADFPGMKRLERAAKICLVWSTVVIVVGRVVGMRVYGTKVEAVGSNMAVRDIVDYTDDSWLRRRQDGGTQGSSSRGS